MNQLLDQAAQYLPDALVAIGIVLLGWIVGRLLARLTTKLVDRLAPDLDKRATRLAVAPLGVQRRVSEIVGALVFWLVFILFAGAATEAVGLPVVAGWLASAAAFVPRVLVAIVIVLAGVLGGALVRNAVASAARAGGLSRGDLLGRAAQIVIVTAAIVTGVEQVGIDSQFLTGVLTVTIGAGLGGAALAFAFGARTDAGNIVAMHYVRQSFAVGQNIRVNGVEGRIKELTATSVILESAASDIRVPGRLFSEQVAEVISAS